MAQRKSVFIDQDAVRGILDNLGGRFVTVTAVKINGKTTRHNGQLRASPPSHDGNDNLFTLARSGDGSFRSFKDTHITRIAGDGVVYKVKSSLCNLI